ncbi:MAG: ATP-dependent helicase, partial [Pseudomonadota bacterium]
MTKGTSNALIDVSDFASSLNDAQQRAATCGVAPGSTEPSSPLLIIAGAGTGKTNTLAHRVAWLLLCGVPSERIALMTFSRRAAIEMTRRVERIVEATSVSARRAGSARHVNPRHLWSGTFHSIGNRLLRQYAASVGLDPAFSVIDRGDSVDLIDMIRQDQGFAKKSRRFPRKETCLAIYSQKVNTGLSLKDTLESRYPWCAEWCDELNGLFREYVSIKQSQQCLDYDDLLIYWHVMLQEPQLAAQIGERFDHILVDEYQDTNRLQSEILMALKPEGTGLCVVGDDAQSIYSFRAATVDNILTFPQRFASAANTVTLDQNYRSTQPILDAANQLMAEGQQGFEKNLKANNQGGQKPRYVTVGDLNDEADYVVEQVLARREEGTPLREQAVLMRKSSDSDLLEVELVRRNIPYAKYGGLKFLEAVHVKDVLALLRFVDNPRNRLAGFRTLQLLPGIGPGTADQCLDHLSNAQHDLYALSSFATPAATAEDWPDFVALLLSLASSEAWSGQMTQVRTWYEPRIEQLHGAGDVRAGDIEQLEAMSEQYRSRDQFLVELTLDPPQATGDEAG